MAISMEELYEKDFYAWTQRQAAALRCLADTRPNVDLDFPHLIEEVEDLGTSQRDAVRSPLRRIIEHCLKLEYSRAAARARAGGIRSLTLAPGSTTSSARRFAATLTSSCLGCGRRRGPRPTTPCAASASPIPPTCCRPTVPTPSTTCSRTAGTRPTAAACPTIGDEPCVGLGLLPVTQGQRLQTRHGLQRPRRRRDQLLQAAFDAG